MYFTNQVLRSDFQLESTYSCAHIDVRKIQTGAMNISRKKFLHPDGRASATDIPCERKQILDRYKVALLVAAHFGSQLEVHLVLAGNDADEMSGFVTMQDQCLEHTIDILAQRGCHVGGAEVVLVHLVGNQFVSHLGLVQKAGGVGFVYFVFHTNNNLAGFARNG